MLKALTRRRAARRIQRAKAAHEELRFEEERKQWEAVLTDRPQHPNALRRAAEMAALDNEPERAEMLWTQALAVPNLEARAHGELARRALTRDDMEAARKHAELFLAQTPRERRAFSLRRQIESLHAHLVTDPARRDIHHICVTGVAFSGSTLLGHLLGRLPGVSNIGESHWLVHRRVEREGMDIDFDADRDEPLFHCNHCGPECAIWTWERRRALSEDRRDWFFRIGTELGTRTLVSTDKNQLKHLTQDPWLRFDALVLFRHPRNAWGSAVRPGRKWRDVVPYLRRWDEHYRKLAFDLPNRGQKLFLDLDRFRQDPDGHMTRLRQLLDLSEPTKDEEPPAEHSIGGNGRVVTAFRDRPSVAVVADGHQALADEETLHTDDYARGSAVYAYLQKQHAAVFGESSEPGA